MKKAICLLFLAFWLSLKIQAQDSYLYEVVGPFSNIPTFFNIESSGYDEVGLQFISLVEDTLGWGFVLLDEVGNLVEKKHIHFGNQQWTHVLPFSYKYLSGNYLLSFRAIRGYSTISGFVCADLVNDVYWGRKSINHPLGPIVSQSVFVSGEQLITSYYIDGQSGLASFNVLEQSQVWSNGFKLFHPDSSVSLIDKILGLSVFPDGSVSVLVNRSDDWYAVNALVISMDGELLTSVDLKFVEELSISPTKLTQIVDTEGNVFISGIGIDSLSGSQETFIVKFNQQYEFIWKKVFKVDHFPFYDLKIAPADDGGVLFTYATTGDLPVIYGKISSDGDLLWYKGFSFYRPRMTILSDGSVAFLSGKKYYENGDWEPAIMLAKTNVEGEIENCPQYDACVELEAKEDVIVSPVSWITEEGPILDSFEVRPKDLPITLTPYCGSPTPPHPYFVLPDTICAGDCLTPDSTYNRLAHQVEWYITGPGGLDTTIIDTTFTWCFDQPGHYQVEQGIWLLGCSDYYLRDVVVLPDDLAPALGEDRVLCEQPPYSLSANASRPLRSYLWSDGSIAAELAITASGTYWLEASDGYCMLRDTVELTFLEDLLSQGPALSLPADTAVCEQHLPYELLPQSPYTGDFSVPAISNSSASSFELWQAGSYEVQAELFGCSIKDSFALEVNDCRSRIYFPTAFSPNGDGLNDLFLPQGKDYEGIELQVYDRWGGLLFSSQSPPFAWNGGYAASGVYVYRFRYWNTLALQEEEISGQVVLLR